MRIRSLFPFTASAWAALVIGWFMLSLPPTAAAQRQLTPGGEQPTAHSSMPKPPAEDAAAHPAMRVFEAICWYLPNRILDIADIPRFHLGIGDGGGITVRATKYLYASRFQDNALCVGLTKRMPLVFGEKIEESYFGFLAARQGELDRDPTEIGVSAHLIVAGLNLAVSAGELVDAVVGIVGIDLVGDDHGPVMYDYTLGPSDAEKELQQKVYGPQEGADAPVDPNAPQPGVANTGMPKGLGGGGTGATTAPALPRR